MHHPSQESSGDPWGGPASHLPCPTAALGAASPSAVPSGAVPSRARCCGPVLPCRAPGCRVHTPLPAGSPSAAPAAPSPARPPLRVLAALPPPLPGSRPSFRVCDRQGSGSPETSGTHMHTPPSVREPATDSGGVTWSLVDRGAPSFTASRGCSRVEPACGANVQSSTPEAGQELSWGIGSFNR